MHADLIPIPSPSSVLLWNVISLSLSLYILAHKHLLSLTTTHQSATVASFLDFLIKKGAEMKFQKSEIAKMAVILFFLLIIPFISTSMRPSYFYFLFNLLIVSLGIESGILSSSSKPSDYKKFKPAAVSPPWSNAPISAYTYNVTSPILDASEKPEKQPAKAVENPDVAKVHRLRKCPSVPSLFFIGNCSSSEVEEDVEEEVPEISGQELFTRAEMFIGNFYKQLKIQREASWNKIHGLYHKA